LDAPVPVLQRSEQNFTFSQSRSHFLRQVKGRAQRKQVLLGSSDFFRPRIGEGVVM